MSDWLDAILTPEDTDPKGYRSPSGINMYLRCPRQWMYRYAEGIKIPPSGALVQGLSVHDGAAVDLRYRLENDDELPEDDVLDAVSTAFDHLAETAEWQDDEDPGKLKDQAISLASTWKKTVSPYIVPAAVEQEWQIKLGDVVYLGRYDCIAGNGTIIDLKTTNRKPQATALTHNLQAQSYALARWYETKAIPLVHYDYLVKTENPYSVGMDAQYTQRQLEIVAETVLEVTRAIRAGIFPRRCDGWWCSKKFCGYYDMCMS